MADKAAINNQHMTRLPLETTLLHHGVMKLHLGTILLLLLAVLHGASLPLLLLLLLEATIHGEPLPLPLLLLLEAMILGVHPLHLLPLLQQAMTLGVLALPLSLEMVLGARHLHLVQLPNLLRPFKLLPLKLSLLLVLLLLLYRLPLLLLLVLGAAHLLLYPPRCQRFLRVWKKCPLKVNPRTLVVAAMAGALTTATTLVEVGILAKLHGRNCNSFHQCNSIFLAPDTLISKNVKQ